jgi:hypothetical protein
MRIEHGQKVRQYDVNRVCRNAVCTVRLSRYNPEEYCGVHAKQAAEMLTRRRWRSR